MRVKKEGKENAISGGANGGARSAQEEKIQADLEAMRV